jgi:hypothetical protein
LQENLMFIGVKRYMRWSEDPHQNIGLRRARV